VADSTPGPGGPNNYPIKPRFEYRAPSFLWDHRYLLIFFVIVIIVVTVLLFRVPHRQYRGLNIHPAPTSEPVYVQPISEPPPSERPASSAK
jgi:hypothetical protein